MERKHHNITVGVVVRKLYIPFMILKKITFSIRCNHDKNKANKYLNKI